MLGTINFISALPCGTGGYTSRTQRVPVNATTEKRDLIELPDTDGETIIRKIRETAQNGCPPGQIFVRGNCRAIKP